MSQDLPLSEIARLDAQKTLIADLRMPEEFAFQHVAGSVNLPLRPALASWAGDLIAGNPPIYLILKNLSDLSHALSALRLAGLDHILGYALFDGSLLAKSPVALDSFPLLSPIMVARKREEAEGRYCILDVRTAEERQVSYIPGSQFIELAVLQHHFSELPRNTPIAVVCRSGYRSSIAASMLQRAGFNEVSNMMGGMTAWANEWLPVISSP